MAEKLKILIVDDEEIILALLKVCMEKDFDLLLANSFSMATELFAKHQHEIKALIADLVLPDGNGCDLAKKFYQEKEGNLAVIIMSGYDYKAVIEENGFLFFQKPMSLINLRDKIKELLKQ